MVADALAAFWDTPATKRGRRGVAHHVSPSVEAFARFLLAYLTTFTVEGNWSVPYPYYLKLGPVFPGEGLPGCDRLKVSETFPSFTELTEAAKDLLLGRDTQARRDAEPFRQLLHLPHFATFQREPNLNFALACWLQDWEILFWKWQSKTASAFGLCRVPTGDDIANDAKASRTLTFGFGNPLDTNTLSSTVQHRSTMPSTSGLCPRALTGGSTACASTSHTPTGQTEPRPKSLSAG
jgi:hypothetical protein